MPRFDTINFYQNRHTIKLFLQKIQNFRELDAPPPDPLASGGMRLRPRPPKYPSQLQIFGYAPARKTVHLCSSTK